VDDVVRRKRAAPGAARGGRRACPA
jgi:hypothetical protein